MYRLSHHPGCAFLGMAAFTGPGAAILLILIVIIGINVIAYACGMTFWEFVITSLLVVVLTAILTYIFTRAYLDKKDAERLQQMQEEMERLPKSFTPTSSKDDKAAQQVIQFLLDRHAQLFPNEEDLEPVDEQPEGWMSKEQLAQPHYRDEATKRDLRRTKEQLQQFLESPNFKNLIRTIHWLGYEITLTRHENHNKE